MAEGVGRAALCPQKFYKRGFGECLDTDLVFECNVIGELGTMLDIFSSLPMLLSLVFRGIIEIIQEMGVVDIGKD